MGKSVSKEEKEEIIIAQTGAGNSATASETTTHLSTRVELYTLAILTLVLCVIFYIVWKRCKMQFTNFMRRTLLDTSVVVRGQPENPIPQKNPGCQQVIV